LPADTGLAESWTWVAPVKAFVKQWVIGSILLDFRCPFYSNRGMKIAKKTENFYTLLPWTMRQAGALEDEACP